MSVKVPSWDELLLDALKAYKDGQPHKNSQVKATVADGLGLPDDIRRQVYDKSKFNRVENRVGWAISAIKIAGLLEKHSHGSYKITDEGLKLLENPPAIMREKYLIDNYPVYIKHKEEAKGKYSDASATTDNENNSFESLTPRDMIDRAIRELNDELQAELIDQLRGMDPYKFEHVVADLLKKMRYGDIEVTKKSGDKGIDAIVNEDVLGLDKIYVQAKRYGEDTIVHEKEMRDFIGALSIKNVKKGVFVTTSSFDKNAREAASNLNASIILIDSNKLTELMIEYNVGVSEESCYYIKKLDTDYFEE